MAAEIVEESFPDVAPHLQDLVLDNPDVEQFLQDLAVYSGERLSVPDHEVFCGITLIRRKKATTVASSNPCARLMDELQNKYGDGPCLTAMREMVTVHVPDLSLETRWPGYVRAVVGQGTESLLSVPLPLEGETRGALNLYSQRTHAFTVESIAAVEAFCEQASKGLRLALRMGQLQDTKENMTAAMQSRTVIDLATGAIMAQNRCSQDEAFKVLVRASSTRNMKLHDVATGVIASISRSSEVVTFFDE
ncbi:GAF and ANTAR domain-containing protein [Arthrobacter sp. CDRTa11]|uniref:GAF and ANTAR domain-containing protein n=1 Tax=Arthrobacter sp. CDRTa11 TaxID=2651199 RepID=UPI0022657F89|nr:GAF and ANTAR domain-containing protein [Arthrobacter sp. CDRTa11]